MAGAMKRVTVFCGAGAGSGAAYVEAAREMGSALARRGIDLVYGGSSLGTMGVLATAAVAAGGRVIGVVPRLLIEREIAYTALPDLRVVDTLSERKALMAELADAFVALPGGFGTLDELFEMVTWAQLGLQRKPCGLLNVRGYYDSLLAFLDHGTAERFIRPEHRASLLAARTVDELLEELAARAR